MGHTTPRRSRSVSGTKRCAVSRLEVIVSLGALATAAWLLAPPFGGGRVAERRLQCLDHLNRIGTALGAYLNEHDQRWPFVAKLASLKLHDPPWPTLPVVLAPYAADPAIFRCPADARSLADDSPLQKSYPARTTWHATEGLSYEWLWGEAYAGKKVGDESLAKAAGFGMGRADQPLLSDFEPFHKGDGGGSFNTLNADLKARTSRARDRQG